MCSFCASIEPVQNSCVAKIYVIVKFHFSSLNDQICIIGNLFSLNRKFVQTSLSDVTIKRPIHAKLDWAYNDKC